ncbi:hypothetical protein GCM10029978_110290 [Actinoallomurus acanthiterrae]
MRVTTRETPDPAGRRVDIYVRPERLCVLIMEAGVDSSKEQLRQAVYEVMRELHALGVKRLRDRDLTIFFCEWNMLGRSLRGIGLPQSPAKRLFDLFRRHPKIADLVVEVEDGDPRDAGAEPLMRYSYGRVIAYADPFDDASEFASLGSNIEIRSAVLKERAIRKSVPRWALPTVAQRRGLPFRHTMDDWSDRRGEIIRFIGEMLSNGSYQWLRRETRQGFGIRVEERAASKTGRFGALSLDWIAEDLTHEIVISINKDLSAADKYVVLAHELAHVALHLPLLYLGQVAEQGSWLRPGLIDVVEQRITALFADRSVLEQDANALASYLLVPPKIDVGGLANMTIEMGRAVDPNALMWRLFQHSFPETRIENYSWRNLENLDERARREMANVAGLNDIAPESLYLIMLEATLSRSSPEAQRRRQQVEDGIAEVFAAPNPSTTRAGGIDAGGHIAFVADGPAQGRQIIDPLVCPDPLAPRVPLVPAPGGRTWRSVLDPTAPARLLEEWRREHPDAAMALYPNRSVPSFPVLTF